MERDRPEGWKPNWLAVDKSDIWHDQIWPWLEVMRQDALEEKSPEAPGAAGATLEQYHYWRGYCFALKAIMDMPRDMIEINRKLLAQEKDDAILQEQQERRILRSL